MNSQRSPRVDRDAAEHLVAGPVASVLRAAAAPPYRGELAGEDAAVAAFRIAVPGRKPVFRKAIAKALTVKAAVVLTIAGSTGVVLAATEGALPVPWSNTPPTTTPPPAPNAPGARTSDVRPPPAAPDPSITGLCCEDVVSTTPAKPHENQGKQNENPRSTQTGRPARTGKPERTTTTTEPAGESTEDIGNETPGSPALGAATAVPPSGAEPPSTGG